MIKSSCSPNQILKDLKANFLAQLYRIRAVEAFYLFQLKYPSKLTLFPYLYKLEVNFEVIKNVSLFK